MLNLAAYTTLSLYEENFSKLMALLQGLDDISNSASLQAPGLPRLNLLVVERSAYTTTITFSLSPNINDNLIRPQHMKIRIYHDAQVAEVLAYQHVTHFQPFYSYPNPKMFQPYEKRRVNQFLGEWLRHCLDNHYHLSTSKQPFPR